MIISHKHKFVCLNPPKTGTGFREKSLEPHANIFQKNTDAIIRHNTIRNTFAYVRRNKVDIRGYMMITFVRNPWSRMISWYNMRVSQQFRWDIGLHHKRSNPPSINETKWLYETKHRRDHGCFSKDKYNDQFEKTTKRMLTSDELYKFINESYRSRNPINSPLEAWLKFRKHEADFVGCLENMEDDMNKMCELVGITDFKTPDPRETHIITVHDMIKPIWDDRCSKLIEDKEKFVIEMKGYKP